LPDSYDTTGDSPNRSFKFWDTSIQNSIGAHAAVHNALDASMDLIQSLRDEAYRNAVLTDCDLAPFGNIEYNIDIPNLDADNVLLPAGEAIVSAMCSQKYVPMLITENGDFQQKKTARLNNQMLAGAFQKYGVHRLRHELAWDALRNRGGGVTKTVYDGADLSHERCFSWEIFVDPREARLGWKGVRTLYHRYLVDREKLYEQMLAKGVEKKKLETIWTYEGDSIDRDFYGVQTISDQVPFVEAYHLGYGNQEGCYFGGIRGETFFIEGYEKPYFPYSFMYQFHPGSGVWAKPFVTQQWPQQKFYDELTQSTINAIKKGGQPRLAVYGNSKPSVMYAGENQEFAYVRMEANARKPETLTFNPINPQVEEYRRSIPSRIAQNAGVPEQWVSGRVPAWLQEASGRAQQVAVEEGSKRMEPTFECMEEYFLDVGKKLMGAIRDAADVDPSFEIPIVTSKFRKKLKVNEVLMPDGEFDLIVHPANVRFRSPAAKFSSADVWLEKQAISVDEWREFQDMPDLESDNEYKSASRRIIEKNLDHIREHSVQMEAFPTDNHDLIVQMATEAANASRINDEGDEVYQLLADYASSAMEEKMKLQVSLQTMGAGMAGAMAASQEPPPGTAPQEDGAPMGPSGAEASSGLGPGQMGGAVPTA
jgi:hypothetical protein